ncbi:MAG: phosphohydrolase [Tolumonas sp.]|nr:MAG: phosphohydrolase [Tolumonas sp.]
MFSTSFPSFRTSIETYIRENALPVDKYSHQPRLYALTLQLAQSAGLAYDDDILHAAVWLHDLGVFEGHRPVDPDALSKWNNVAYACEMIPALLTSWRFPAEKIPAVIDAIRQHVANGRPAKPEAILLHDADLLELLGAVGIMRALSKVGRDTRYTTHGSVVKVLESALQLPDQLLLPAAKLIAEQKVSVLQMFLTALTNETYGISY